MTILREDGRREVQWGRVQGAEPVEAGSAALDRVEASPVHAVPVRLETVLG